ncbi:centriolar and ciliogenesis-associated protein HYLS1-like [Rhopilema esculentum]|uniref:centriolar and ciliogenesis-associated protein HYLS1-like n=1 Tax=Rhopilema esculentum TaxID=499914 RepID=UPI0031D6ABD2
MAESISFTENEVRKKLKELGYGDIPYDQLRLFMKDLDELIKYELSNTSDGSFSVTDDADSFNSEPLQNFPKWTEVSHKVPFSKSKIYDLEEKENIGYAQEFRNREAPSILSESTLSTVDSNLESTTSSQVTRRKVARKRNGVTRVFDETHTEDESEASDITLLEERLRSLPIRSLSDENHSEQESVSDASSLVKMEKRHLPSYIRPSTAPPTQGRSRKFDPVNRYHQFKHEWKQQRVPGESRHDTLRWNVREQMLNCHVYERPQHLMKQNRYQVPTGKKRQALRWEVRCALAKI